MSRLASWTAFWLLKFGGALAVWYMIDDRLANHFAAPELGNVPIYLVVGLSLLLSLISEQYSVVRVIDPR